ncbi:hypothetical protein GJ496_006175 [Pomphorhynchus laevis]|nr:hypothetical protein GJ496_006175 [Pomphorhynchus laevis]
MKLMENKRNKQIDHRLAYLGSAVQYLLTISDFKSAFHFGLNAAEMMPSVSADASVVVCPRCGWQRNAKISNQDNFQYRQIKVIRKKRNRKYLSLKCSQCEYVVKFSFSGMQSRYSVSVNQMRTSREHPKSLNTNILMKRLSQQNMLENFLSGL